MLSEFSINSSRAPIGSAVHHGFLIARKAIAQLPISVFALRRNYAIELQGCRFIITNVPPSRFYTQCNCCDVQR